MFLGIPTAYTLGTYFCLVTDIRKKISGKKVTWKKSSVTYIKIHKI